MVKLEVGLTYGRINYNTSGLFVTLMFYYLQFNNTLCVVTCYTLGLNVAFSY